MTRGDLVQLDCIDVPVIVLEQDALGIPCYRHINAKGLELYGDTLGDFLGKSAAQVFPGEDGRKTLRHHIECFLTGKPVDYNVSVVTSQMQREYRIQLMPQIGADGAVLRVLGTGHDITEAQDAQQIKQGLDHAQTEQFVTLAAHDLRTPMRNIRNLTAMLRENFEDRGDGKVELIDMLEDVATKSSTLISEILQYSLTTRTKASVCSFALSELCADIDAILNPQNEHDIQWPDAILETDRMVVQVVIRNLVDNAIKYGARDRLTIDISTWAEDSRRVGFAVEDNGQGMTNPGIAFLNSGQMHADSGYGLLSIRRLLTARQGSISARHGPKGKGTRVVFKLPGVLQPAHVFTPGSYPKRRVARG